VVIDNFLLCVLEDRIRGVAEDELENAGENDVVTYSTADALTTGFPQGRSRKP